MNISYKWLKEYVDTTLSAQEIADALTSAGLEVDGVEEVQTIKGGLEGLYVAEVLTCEPHPDSDHMHVCMVSIDPSKSPLKGETCESRIYHFAIYYPPSVPPCCSILCASPCRTRQKRALSRL